MSALLTPRRLTTTFAALALLHCGGQAQSVGAPGPGPEDAGGSDAGPVGYDAGPVVYPGNFDAGSCQGSPNAPTEVPPNHRATASTCTPTKYLGGNDAGGACKSSNDCPLNLHCWQGQCTLDTCLTDSDCASGTVCVCGDTFYGGNAAHGNVCVTAACKTDSDCGTNGYCSPSIGYCGGIESFNCHTPKDTCTNPQTDCGNCGNQCSYSPQVGHFVCVQVICAG